MALQKVLSNIRHHMRIIAQASARHYTNEADYNSLKLDQKNQVDHTDEDQTGFQTENRPRVADAINDVFLVGTVFGEVLPTTLGNGVTFLVDITHQGKYGPYKVRTKVIAIGTALPPEGSDAIVEGQKLFVRGRLGSKVERSLDGTSVVRSTHVVSRVLTLL